MNLDLLVNVTIEEAEQKRGGRFGSGCDTNDLNLYRFCTPPLLWRRLLSCFVLLTELS